MDKPRLTYFASRGRAELTRLVLAEAGVDYDERLVGKDVDFPSLKASGQLPFEAIPVWDEPDGFRLAQSGAIATYLATKHGLRGATVREAAHCDQMLGAFDDVRAELRKLALAGPHERDLRRAELETKTLPRWLGWLDRLLAANRDGTAFVVGDGITVADLELYYLIEMIGDNGFAAL